MVVRMRRMIRTVVVWNISWFSSRRLLSIVTDRSLLLLIMHPTLKCLYLPVFVSVVYLYFICICVCICICQPEVAVNCYRSLPTSPHHASNPQMFVFTCICVCSISVFYLYLCLYLYLPTRGCCQLLLIAPHFSSLCILFSGSPFISQLQIVHPKCLLWRNCSVLPAFLRLF